MVDSAPPTDSSHEPARNEDLPDRLRVHQLARALGSTNKEVLAALTAIDGRDRNVHSGVDREDAIKVRELLFAQPLPNIPGFSSAAAAQQPLLLDASSAGRDYMPLFVAPQPVEIGGERDTDDDSADSDDSDSDDDEQADRPANRRRRRGRRGRGRGRGEQGGADGQDIDEDADSEDTDEDDSDAGDDENGSSEAASRRRRRRRRRKSGAGDDGDEGPSPDDPPNTVVHERPPRSGKNGDDSGSSNAEIKGIDGSTRLEAKRQRRRSDI